MAVVKKSKSVIKRARKSEKARKINAANRRVLAKESKKFIAAVKAGDKAAAKTAFNAFSSVADKSAKKGAISKNAASRRKSRAAAKVAAMA